MNVTNSQAFQQRSKLAQHSCRKVRATPIRGVGLKNKREMGSILFAHVAFWQQVKIVFKKSTFKTFASQRRGECKLQVQFKCKRKFQARKVQDCRNNPNNRSKPTISLIPNAPTTCAKHWGLPHKFWRNYSDEVPIGN